MDIRDPNGGDQLSAGFLDGLLGSAKANAVRAATNGVGVRQESNGQTITITEPRPFWAKLGGDANPYRLYPLTANASGGDDVFSPGIGLTGIEVNGTAGLSGKIVLIEPVNGQNFFNYNRYGVWQPDNRWVCATVGDNCCGIVNGRLAGATVTITDAANGDVIATGTTDADGRYCFPLPWLVSRPVNWTISKFGLTTATGTTTIPDANGYPGYLGTTLEPAAPNGCFRACCPNLPIKGPLDFHIEGTLKHCWWGRFGNFSEYGSFGPSDLKMTYDGYVGFYTNPYTFSTEGGPCWSAPFSIQMYRGSSYPGGSPGNTYGTRVYFYCANSSFGSSATIVIGTPGYNGIVMPSLWSFRIKNFTLTCSPFLATFGPSTTPDYSKPCPVNYYSDQQESWAWNGVYISIAEAP